MPDSEPSMFTLACGRRADDPIRQEWMKAAREALAKEQKKS